MPAPCPPPESIPEAGPARQNSSGGASGGPASRQAAAALGDGLAAAVQRVPALFFTEDFSLNK